MDLSYGPEHEAFRTEVRAFLRQNWTDEDRQHNPPPRPTWLIAPVNRLDPAATRFRATGIARGYLYRHVPKRYGGGGAPWDPAKEMIIAEEFTRAQAPAELIGNGPNVLVPTLLECGTEAQKRRFIGNVLLGTEYWCQGYSEPGAGSDLASLRTHAVLEGEAWTVKGHKIWTSMADVSDWMFALVRTEPDAPKHKGLSYLLIDMRTPGITVRPLVQMNGEREFSEVFLDDVRVPATNMVGQRGAGWAVSMSALKHERQFAGATLVHPRMLDGVVALAKASRIRGRPAVQDPVIRDRLAALQARMHANTYHAYRLTTMGLRAQDPGVAGMVAKLYGSTLAYELAKLAMDIVADGGVLWAESAPAAGIAPNSYMQAFGVLAGGGTANIQRNVIAERGLGLPRGPKR
jgi:alkylation response protein AidB-like acyl-CoA dehydrogenase